MGSKKKSSSKAPKATPPPSINAPFGSANYSNGAYTFSSPDDGQNSQNFQTANRGFAAALEQLQNPTAAIQQQQNVYRNAMEPAFQRESDARMAEATAGLGRRYNSTFGALTMDKQAQNEGLARANLEKSIYDSGQQSYNQMLQNAGLQGGLAQSANSIRLSPYELLGQLIAQATPGQNSLNSFNSGIYATQNQNQNSGGGLGSMIGGLGSMAASVAPLFI